MPAFHKVYFCIGRTIESFLLSRHNGLSNKQIAERLHISVKTVENQMTAALSKLREFFAHSDLGSAVFFYYFFS
jgi:RNA polymerase sigma-70 factor (ECF subfamily)